MKLCIPTEDSGGLDARVCAHFGSAPFFTVVDTESEVIELLNNQNVSHSHGDCNPVSSIDSQKVDAVVCGGLGKRALMRLQQSGFEVYLSRSQSVREVVAEQKAGTLHKARVEEACGGHSHGGGSGCGEGGGQRQRQRD